MAAPIDEVEEDACVNPFSFQRFVSGQNAIDHSQPPAKGRCRLSPTTVGSLRLMDASTGPLEALEEEQEAQRHKEREETAALEQVVRQERASSAELASARLKQQVKTLQVMPRGS
ncbi:hypothetical protein IscW_ISCW019951 [Ixodes scapularis]|uniref:Uncharacterized protein n=1 Tax=Ixodes scapularis TaxID=6945 RepID=B7PRS5_IXOSC|nr:hypothetical protein IscW_ISCW019951 [Ixodes scapularis]|eukprot:XP_002401021.1 hypothetical protein IscW_ISCW019951 [Ixodes scapularis]